MGVFWSGVRIFGMKIITGHPLMGVLGNLVGIVLAGCCVVVLGSAFPRFVAAPFVSGTSRAIATTSSVFAWSCCQVCSFVPVVGEDSSFQLIIGVGNAPGDLRNRVFGKKPGFWWVIRFGWQRYCTRM
jgi:hypothetical protein